MADERLEMLRHTVATVAYRGGKTLRNAPESFGEFRVGKSTRTPVQILAHLGDLFDWALTMVQGKEAWHDSAPLPWAREVERFFAAPEAFDRCLASGAKPATSGERLFQGPVADALTHIGQLALLRRLAEAPVRGENYARAEIRAGRLGLDQSPPVREFD